MVTDGSARFRKRLNPMGLPKTVHRRVRQRLAGQWPPGGHVGRV